MFCFVIQYNYLNYILFAGVQNNACWWRCHKEEIMKLLTVAVPSYNSQDYLANALDSLLLGGERVEVVIVNDGSKDNTGAIADEYVAKYPSIFKVVHQENGGHGEGINQGLKNATGKYFYVLDSDDTVTDKLPELLDRLEKLEQDVDLVVVNYMYRHTDGKGDKTMHYRNVFPRDKVVGWDDTKPFKIDQFLMLHSAIFRTQLMRDINMVLPKHTFYEDNLMLYKCMRHSKSIIYYDLDMYNYTIGVVGQSMEEANMAKRYIQQVNVTREIFREIELDKVKTESKAQYKALKHGAFLMLAGATAMSRLNNTDKADQDLEQMWNDVKEISAVEGNYFRHKSLLKFINLKGKTGRKVSIFFYRLSKRFVRFN